MNDDVSANGAASGAEAGAGSGPGHPGRRAAVSTGNPRINVAFPFAKIAVQEPSEALSDLAALVAEIAEQLAALTRQADADQAETADRLAAQAVVLARRLGVG
jgi:hypothetical protein